MLAPKKIPLVGGIAVTIGFSVASFFGSFSRGQVSIGTIGILVASLCMLVFGIIDDRHELSIIGKIIVQVISCTLLVVFGIRTQIAGIGYLLNIAVTFIWVLTIANAFNHLDVMDGVCATAGLVTSLAFIYIAYLNQDYLSVTLLLALSGALTGFLLFNLPPARVYLGNSGSHYLGFVLAAVALAISYAPMERKVALISPVLILGFPIFDTGFLVLMRLVKNKVPFEKSNDHLVLRFLSAGYNKKKALLAMFLCNLFFAASGVAVSKSTNFLGSIIISCVVLISLLLAYRMSKVAVND